MGLSGCSYNLLSHWFIWFIPTRVLLLHCWSMQVDLMTLKFTSCLQLAGSMWFHLRAAYMCFKPQDQTAPSQC